MQRPLGKRDEAESMQNIQDMYELMKDIPHASKADRSMSFAPSISRTVSRILKCSNDGQLYMDHWMNGEVHSRVITLHD